MDGSFTRAQVASIRRALEEGKTPLCPSCRVPLRPTPILPRSDVAYVRRRVLLECDSCRRRTVLDHG